MGSIGYCILHVRFSDHLAAAYDLCVVRVLVGHLNFLIRISIVELEVERSQIPFLLEWHHIITYLQALIIALLDYHFHNHFSNSW